MARAMVGQIQPVGGPGTALYSRTRPSPPGNEVLAAQALQGGGGKVGGNADQMAANRAETRLTLVGCVPDAFPIRGVSSTGCIWLYQVS